MSASSCQWCGRFASRKRPVSLVSPLGQHLCQDCQDEYLHLPDFFVSWVDLCDQTPEEPAWIWKDYLAEGEVTLLAGKPKYAGKSTLACALAEAVDAGAESFLGRKLSGGPVVYVSEEGPGSLLPKLSASERSLVLPRTYPKPSWIGLLHASVERAQGIGAVLLVIDSFSFWASFREGQAKDPAAAQQMMDVLAIATDAGLAVLLVHHQRKGGGEDGEAIRDSSSILAAVDTAVELERIVDARPTQRRLVSMGRHSSTPAVLVVDRNPLTGAYRAVGEAESRAETTKLGMRERILKVLDGPGKPSLDELEKLLGIDRRKFHDDLQSLLRDGLVARSGQGRRGNPYRFEKPSQKPSPAGTESPLKKPSDPEGEDGFNRNRSEKVSQEGTENGGDPLADQQIRSSDDR